MDVEEGKPVKHNDETRKEVQADRNKKLFAIWGRVERSGAEMNGIDTWDRDDTMNTKEEEKENIPIDQPPPAAARMLPMLVSACSASATTPPPTWVGHHHHYYYFHDPQQPGHHGLLTIPIPTWSTSRS